MWEQGAIKVRMDASLRTLGGDEHAGTEEFDARSRDRRGSLVGEDRAPDVGRQTELYEREERLWWLPESGRLGHA